MTQVFTDEKFTGYTFECTSKSANTGFYHICTVIDNTGNEVLTTKQHWINRTWESYPFQTVFESAKAELENKLAGTKETKEEYDTDFLYTLANEGYIRDYGYTDNDELIIVFDSWSEVEGEDEREYVEGKGMIKTGNFKKSVYAKLRELADKDLLKPSINKTIKEVEYVFSDSYMQCDDCGKWICSEYGDIRYYEELDMCLCSECSNSSDYIENFIESAKGDFRKAISVEVDDDLIENLGYEKLDPNKDFSTRMSQWGESSWGCHNTPIAQVEDLCQTYGGFAKLTYVGQFDAEYQLYFPSETVNEAREEFGVELEEV